MEDSYMELPLQDLNEWKEFLKILVEAKAKSYLEIGSMWGRSLWSVGNVLPPGSTIVAIDSMIDRKESYQSLVNCVAKLKMKGLNAHFIYGESTDPKTIKTARELGPYDALFIDGNHSREYVQADWDNYGEMAKIVGFHDINYDKSWGGKIKPEGMGAQKVWDIVKLEIGRASCRDIVQHADRTRVRNRNKQQPGI